MTATSQKPIFKVSNEALFIGQIIYCISLKQINRQERNNKQHNYLSIFCPLPPSLFDTLSPYLEKVMLLLIHVNFNWWGIDEKKKDLLILGMILLSFFDLFIYFYLHNRTLSRLCLLPILSCNIIAPCWG